MTIRDFLEMCAMEGIKVILYDLNSESTIEIVTSEIYDVPDSIMDASFISWDYMSLDGCEDLALCLNYEG